MKKGNNERDTTQIICPSCESNIFIEDMVRFFICNKCNFVKCPGCDEWVSGGEDGLNYHYYADGCRLKK